MLIACVPDAGRGGERARAGRERGGRRGRGTSDTERVLRTRQARPAPRRTHQSSQCPPPPFREALLPPPAPLGALPKVDTNAKKAYEADYWKGILDAQGKNDGTYY